MGADLHRVHTNQNSVWLFRRSVRLPFTGCGIHLSVKRMDGTYGQANTPLTKISSSHCTHRMSFNGFQKLTSSWGFHRGAASYWRENMSMSGSTNRS